MDIASSSLGRVSGKPWKPQKSASRRTQMPSGLRVKTWEDRMEQTKREAAIKKLEREMKEEKQAEATQRREAIKQRRLALEEKKRIEESKALMGARKAARLQRKAGRTKKINH